jgi:hypothetical protein
VTPAPQLKREEESNETLEIIKQREIQKQIQI